MAELKEGILGPIVGKIATVVGVKWRGRNILRSKPTKSRKKATEGQLRQWDKMSLVSTFASKFKGFVNAHCPPALQGTKWLSGKEQMVSRLMTEGIVLHEGVQYINIEKVLLSIGGLAPAVIKKFSRLKTGKLKVQWDNALVNPLTSDTDQLTIMAYHEGLDEFKSIANIGSRIDKYAHFSLPENWQMGNIYLWSMWKATNGSIHSTSCFHGVLELDYAEEGEKQLSKEVNATTPKKEIQNTGSTPQVQYTTDSTEDIEVVSSTLDVEQETRTSIIKKENDTTYLFSDANTQIKDTTVSKNLPLGLIRKVKKQVPKDNKANYTSKSSRQKIDQSLTPKQSKLDGMPSEKDRRDS